MKCPQCHRYKLVIGNAEPVCEHCEYTGEAADVTRDWVTNVYRVSEYGAIKRGDEWPISECPECEQESLVHFVRRKGESGPAGFLCFSCEEVWPEGRLKQCDGCQRFRKPEELEDAVYCNECTRRAIGSF